MLDENVLAYGKGDMRHKKRKDSKAVFADKEHEH